MKNLIKNRSISLTQSDAKYAVFHLALRFI